jgi:hypothetical protein
VEKLGRTRPKTVSAIIEIASRFADGEDASIDEDGRIRRNQVATRYERGNEEGNKNREYQDKNSRR